MDLSALGFAPVEQGNAVAPGEPVDLSSLGFAPVGAPAGGDNFYNDVFNEPEPLIPRGMLSGGIDELANAPIPTASEGMIQAAPPEPVQPTAWWQRPLPPDASEREQLAHERINQLATELPPGKDPEAAYNQELVNFTHGSEADSRIVSFDPITKRVVYAGSYGDPVNRLLDSPVPRGLLNAADSVVTTGADWALGTAGGITGDKGLSDMAEYAGRQRELNKSYDQSLNQRQGKVGAMAAQVTEMMAKYTPIGATGGMAALLPYIYAESTTDALNEAKRAGLGELDAQLYAHSIGAINAGFTALGGAVSSKLGVKTFEELVSSGGTPVLGRLTPPPNSFKALFRGLGRYAQSAGVETLAEEFPTYFAENVARYASGLQDDAVPETMWRDLTDIAAASAIMSIPGGLESVQEGPLTAQMMADMGIPPATAKSQADRDRISQVILNQLDEIEQQQQPPTAPETLPDETEEEEAPPPPPTVETPPEVTQRPTEDVVPLGDQLPVADGRPTQIPGNPLDFRTRRQPGGDLSGMTHEEAVEAKRLEGDEAVAFKLKWAQEAPAGTVLENPDGGIGYVKTRYGGWVQEGNENANVREDDVPGGRLFPLAGWKIRYPESNQSPPSQGQVPPEVTPQKPRGPLSQQVDARRQAQEAMQPAPEAQQERVPADEVAQEPVVVPPAEPAPAQKKPSEPVAKKPVPKKPAVTSDAEVDQLQARLDKAAPKAAGKVKRISPKLLRIEFPGGHAVDVQHVSRVPLEGEALKKALSNYGIKDTPENRQWMQENVGGLFQLRTKDGKPMPVGSLITMRNGLDDADATTILRHELLHFARQAGLIPDEAWSKVTAALAKGKASEGAQQEAINAALQYDPSLLEKIRDMLDAMLEAVGLSTGDVRRLKSELRSGEVFNKKKPAKTAGSVKMGKDGYDLTELDSGQLRMIARSGRAANENYGSSTPVEKLRLAAQKELRSRNLKDYTEGPPESQPLLDAYTKATTARRDLEESLAKAEREARTAHSQAVVEIARKLGVPLGGRGQHGLSAAKQYAGRVKDATSQASSHPKYLAAMKAVGEIKNQVAAAKEAEKQAERDYYVSAAEGMPKVPAGQRRYQLENPTHWVEVKGYDAESGKYRVEYSSGLTGTISPQPLLDNYATKDQLDDLGKIEKQASTLDSEQKIKAGKKAAAERDKQEVEKLLFNRKRAKESRKELLKEGREKPADTTVEADMVLDATDLGEGTDKDSRFKFQPGYKRVKQIADAAPEFAYEPVFTVNSKKQLVYKDGVTYTLDPALFNLHPSELKEGQTVGINLEDIGLKRLTAGEAVSKALKNDGFKNVRSKPSGAITASWGNTPITISGDGSSWTATPNGTSEGSQKAVKQANQTLKKMHFLAGEQAPPVEPGRAPVVPPPTTEAVPGPAGDSEVQGALDADPFSDTWGEVPDGDKELEPPSPYENGWNEPFEGEGADIEALQQEIDEEKRRVLKKTRNPEFRRWAGTDNVVADASPEGSYDAAARFRLMPEDLLEDEGERFETGRPVVARVYHGSPGSDIHAFSRGKLGKNTGAGSARLGFFFAGSPATSEAYVPSGNRRIELINKSTGTVRGFGLTRREAIEDAATREGLEPEDIKRYIEDGTWLWQGTDIDEDGGPGMIPAFVRMRNPYVHDYKGSGYREETYRDVIARAKEAGHDGVILLNTEDGGPIDNIFVVFSPKSIKSATANSGEYKEVNNILAGKEGGTLVDEIDQKQVRGTTQVKLDAIPEDLEIEVEGVRKNGEKVKIKKSARDVLATLDSDIAAYRKLVSCLGK